jgi:hypothetical protein
MLKGQSDYHSNQIQSRRPDRGPVDRVKGLLSQGSTQGESWTTALNLSELGQKAARQKNSSLPRERTAHFLCAMLKKGVVDVGDDFEKWEPVESITSPCDSILGYWGLSGKKPV